MAGQARAKLRHGGSSTVPTSPRTRAATQSRSGRGESITPKSNAPPSLRWALGPRAQCCMQPPTEEEDFFRGPLLRADKADKAGGQKNARSGQSSRKTVVLAYRLTELTYRMYQLCVLRRSVTSASCAPCFSMKRTAACTTLESWQLSTMLLSHAVVSSSSTSSCDHEPG